jgi:hypothetical protein
MNSMLISPLHTARILTEVIGKSITHANLTEQEFVLRLTAGGLCEDHATAPASLEGMIKQRGEEKLNDVVLKITGLLLRTFREYAEASKSEWIPQDCIEMETVLQDKNQRCA